MTTGGNQQWRAIASVQLFGTDGQPLDAGWTVTLRVTSLRNGSVAGTQLVTVPLSSSGVAGHVVDALPANGNGAVSDVRFEIVAAESGGPTTREWEGTTSSDEVAKPSSGSC